MTIINKTKEDKNLFDILGLITTISLLITTIILFEKAVKISIIAWAALTAMLLGALLSYKNINSKKGVIWVYGLSGGSALASSFYFLIPPAIKLNTHFGITGVLAGFLTGLSIHSLSHKFFHKERHKGRNTLVSISIHALTAGLIIGLIYQQLPEIGILLGLAIVSHKLPAGYMLANQLRSEGDNLWYKIMFPGSLIGITAFFSFLFTISLSITIQALLFGFSAGIFFHLALDFIPSPEPESHLRKIVMEDEDPIHHQLDRITTHCILSTIIGAILIFILKTLVI